MKWPPPAPDQHESLEHNQESGCCASRALARLPVEKREVLVLSRYFPDI